MGSGVGTSVNDVLNIIRQHYSGGISINYEPSRMFDIKKVVLNISKIRKAIDWEPEIDLDSGIKKIIKLNMDTQ